jgi:hypothetical protein
MRALPGLLLAAVLAAQQASESRSSIRNDWCEVAFEPAARSRALEILAATAPARDRVAERTGITIQGPLTILVVRDGDVMRREVAARTGHEPPDWAGGLALTDSRLVLIRADLQGEPFDRVGSVVTHELVHVALAQARAADGARIPRWFEEGVAQWVAGRARPLDVPDLRPAATFGYLLDLAAMDAAFAHGEGTATRAYAHAESFVRFVARRHGIEKVRATIELLLQGVELDTALFLTTSAGLQTLWGAWRTDLASDKSWMIATGSQALVAILILVVVVLGAIRVFKRKRAIEQSWGEEPGAE